MGRTCGVNCPRSVIRDQSVITGKTCGVNCPTPRSVIRDRSVITGKTCGVNCPRPFNKGPVSNHG